MNFASAARLHVPFFRRADQIHKIRDRGDKIAADCNSLFSLSILYPADSSPVMVTLSALILRITWQSIL